MKLNMIAAITGISASISAAMPATADCISTLAGETSSLAEELIESYKTRGETADLLASETLGFVCDKSGLKSTRTLLNCANAMRSADEKFGKLDVLDWDILRLRLQEFRHHESCEGKFLTEYMPAEIQAPPGTYNKELLGYFEKAREYCDHLEGADRSEGIQCLGAVAQSTYALKVFFNMAIEKVKPKASPSEREEMDAAIANNNEHCDRLKKLRGKFEDVVKPTLEDVSSCVSAINYAAYGGYRDVVGIAHGDLSDIDPKSSLTAYALREASGHALQLNLMRHGMQ